MTFWKNPAAGNELRFQRFCLVAAFVVTLLWCAVYLGYGNSGIEDEPGQMGAIEHFAQKRPGAPPSLPNLPGYHLLVTFLSGGKPTLFSARCVTLGFALLGLAAFAFGWRQRHGRHPGGATLLLALLPIMQPFTAMAYTDVPAMTFLFAAFWAQFAGRFALAAAALTLACFIRQTSLIWAGYLLTMEALNGFFPRPAATLLRSSSARWREGFSLWLDRSRWLLLLVATAAGIILYAGRLTVGVEHGNRFEANLATFHFAGVLLFLLGLPFFIVNLRAMLSAVRAAFANRRARSLALTFFAAGTAAFLALRFSNPHVWNRALFWLDPASTFVLVRNWPLVWIDRLPALHWLSGLNVVAMLAGLAFLFARQRFARELWLILPFGTLLLLSNGLVEPRYFIPPFALALLFLEPSALGVLRQARWFALLCLVQSAFVLDRLALW